MNTEFKSNNAGLIDRYLKNKLSDQERISFEKEMENDPFLKDAVEGFQSFPKSWGKLDKIKSKTSYSFEGKTSTWKSFALWSLGALLVTFSLGYMILYSHSDELEKMEKMDIARRNNEGIQSEETKVEDEILAAQNEVGMYEAIITQDSDSSLSIAIGSEDTYTIPSQNFIQSREINIEEIDKIVQLKIVPLEEEELLEARLKKNYDTYHLEEYKLYDYLEIREKGIESLKPILGGVPASKSNIDQEEPTADLLKEEIPYGEYLGYAIVNMSEGKYKSARIKFKKILELYPDDANALFYKAFASYQLRRYEDANDEFRQSVQCSNKVFLEESEFHLAVSLCKSEQKEEGIQLLEEIKSKGGFYHDQASNYLLIFH